ncbi:MAG: RNA polymerase sigma factor [Planctomycetota bacterium]
MAQGGCLRVEQVRETSTGEGRGDVAPAASPRAAWRPITPLDETRWSQILRLGERGGTPEEQRAWSDAWDYLFATFRPALENQVRRVLRRNGFPEQECEDVVQDFWAKCLEKDWLTKADRQIGKFRTFAYVCARRFTSNHVERARAAKRSPGEGKRFLPQEAAAAVAAPSGTFGEDWELCRLRAALDRVEQRSPVNARWLRAQLGEQLGVSAQAPPESPYVATRARKMLREELAWVDAQSADGARALVTQLRRPDCPANQGGLR